MTRIFPAIAVVAVAVACPAFAQTQPAQQTVTTADSQHPSLGELAKQEAARRKSDSATGEAPKKVYTNADLKPAPAPETADAAADATKAGDTKGATDAKGATDPKDGKDGKDAKASDPKQTEQYWHDLMQQARDDLQHNQMYATALQSQINGLSADFAARDDPYQRAQIADNRQKALAELDRVNAEIEKGKKAMADIEEDARKANVPAGWIR